MVKFKTGDLVRAKMGGPNMTIEVPESRDGFVEVMWFDSNDCLRRDAFNENTLDLLDNEWNVINGK